MSFHSTGGKSGLACMSEKDAIKNRKRLEAEMEGEIDSLLTTRHNARQRLGDAPYASRLIGYGKRTLNAKAGYRTQCVWGSPAKRRHGALD